MPIERDIEKLARNLIGVIKPEVEDDPRIKMAALTAVHIGANLLIDVRRIADALEKIAQNVKLR